MIVTAGSANIHLLLYIQEKGKKKEKKISFCFFLLIYHTTILAVIITLYITFLVYYVLYIHLPAFHHSSSSDPVPLVTESLTSISMIFVLDSKYKRSCSICFYLYCLASMHQ